MIFLTCSVRIVFGTRDCNDVLHTLGGSYLFYKTQVSMIIFNIAAKKVKKKRERKCNAKNSLSNHFEASP